MALLAVNDLVEMRVVCQLADQISVNVWHYECSAVTPVGPDPGITTANCAAFWSDAFEADYRNCMPTTASFYGCGVRTLLPVVSLEDGNNTFANPGVEIDTPLPGYTCGILAKLTGIGGRAFRGRAYIPFPYAGSLDAAGKPSLTYRTRMAGIGAVYLAGSLVTNGTGSTAQLDPVLRHSDNTTTAIVSMSSRLNWGQMHSRGGYGRPNPLPVW